MIGRDEPTGEFLVARNEREDTGHTKTFQVPAGGDSPKSVLESWVITYHAQEKKVTAWYQWLGICWWRRIEIEGARILAVVPNCHFSQEEMESVCAAARNEYSPPRSREESQVSGDTEYTADLERRLRKLDWVVQDEIYDLINDRIQSSSNSFRRREWKLVVLNEVPGGEITEALSGAGRRGHRRLLDRMFRRRRRKAAELPITEYRLILCGTETKANGEGWACHNRYSRPWQVVDDKEIGDVKSSLSRRGSQFGSDKSYEWRCLIVYRNRFNSKAKSNLLGPEGPVALVGQSRCQATALGYNDTNVDTLSANAADCVRRSVDSFVFQALDQNNEILRYNISHR
ncbi:hypothetical protein V8F20_009544 [Naviculisporaceae sp. PSN 640]